MAVRINQEQASREVEAWLDYKRVFERTKEANQDSIEFMEDMICEGILSIDETTHEITHKLLFPLGEGSEITSLKYKSRLNDKMLEPKMKGIKSNDANAMLTAYICALTDENSGVIKGMDSQDKKVAMAIAVFFLYTQRAKTI